MGEQRIHSHWAFIWGWTGEEPFKYQIYFKSPNTFGFKSFLFWACSVDSPLGETLTRNSKMEPWEKFCFRKLVLWVSSWSRFSKRQGLKKKCSVYEFCIFQCFLVSSGNLELLRFWENKSISTFKNSRSTKSNQVCFQIILKQDFKTF